MEQLVLFEEPPPTVEHLQEELEKAKAQINNLRRGLFQRYDNLTNDLDIFRKDIIEIYKLLDVEPHEQSKT